MESTVHFEITNREELEILHRKPLSNPSHVSEF